MIEKNLKKIKTLSCPFSRNTFCIKLPVALGRTSKKTFKKIDFLGDICPLSSDPPPPL